MHSWMQLMGCIVLVIANLPVSAFFDAKASGALDEVLESLDKPDHPGGFVAIIKDNKFVYAKGFGLSNIANNTSNTANTIFHVASITKHVTSISLLKLVEREEVGLEQSVGDFIPELGELASAIRIKDLLNHTSGLSSWTTAATMRGDRIHRFNKTPLQLIKEHGQLEFEPGSEFLYGNTSFEFAALIIERVTGKSLAEFAKDEFFQPLGMTSTSYKIYPYANEATLAIGYVLDAQDRYIQRPSTVKYPGPVGLHTTINDFKKWDYALRKNQLLRPELMQLLRQSFTLNDGTKTNYGYGFRQREYDGMPLLFHGGTDYDFGYVASYGHLKNDDISFILFANSREVNRPQIIGLIIEFIISELSPSLNPQESDSEEDKTTKNSNNQDTIITPPNDLSRYEGTYHSQALDARYTLSLTEDDSLQIEVGVMDPQVLTWTGDNIATSPVYRINQIRLSARGPIFRFTEKEGAITGFQLDAGRINNIAFKKEK